MSGPSFVSQVTTLPLFHELARTSATVPDLVVPAKVTELAFFGFDGAAGRGDAVGVYLVVAVEARQRGVNRSVQNPTVVQICVIGAQGIHLTEFAGVGLLGQKTRCTE